MIGFERVRERERGMGGVDRKGESEGGRRAGRKGGREEGKGGTG